MKYESNLEEQNKSNKLQEKKQVKEHYKKWRERSSREKRATAYHHQIPWWGVILSVLYLDPWWDYLFWN